METVPPSHQACFQVRKAIVQDAHPLVDLRLAFLEEVNRKPNPVGLKENLQAYFQANLATGNFLAWLATADEKIVGTSGLVFMSRPPSYNNLSGRDAYITNMYTLPDWRGCGVGKALFSKTLDYVRTSGCGKAFLHATEQGRPLYKKFGFHPTEEETELTLKISPASDLSVLQVRSK